MPVTLTTAKHAARRWTSPKATTDDKLLQQACPKEHRRSKGIFQSSFTSQVLQESHISPSKHGLVRAVQHSYSYHHHLTLRPEDVWFSILSQLAFFINAHAEELRSLFVAHEGQKELEVVGVGNIYTVDFGVLAVRMTKLIEENVIDPELRTWIFPAFSTTTDSDKVVAAILMMGTLQKYFSYRMALLCGIPSVTLLGDREDWVQLVTKLDKIPELGEEPATFARLLRPVLERFVASFDRPGDPEVLEFWSRCVHKTGGSGPQYLSGWITAFCFWNEDGRPLYCDGSDGPGVLYEFAGHGAGRELDEVLSNRVDTEDVPCGYTSVPVTVNDNGVEHETKMVAGMVGIQATSSGQPLDETDNFYVPAAPSHEPTLDSIRPVSGWWMYKTETKEEKEA